jgi:hypothetical protein
MASRTAINIGALAAYGDRHVEAPSTMPFRRFVGRERHQGVDVGRYSTAKMLEPKCKLLQPPRFCALCGTNILFRGPGPSRWAGGPVVV